MASYVGIRVVWNHSAIPLNLPFKDVHVFPEPGYPAGRKGLQLAGAWQQLASKHDDGLVLVDGDCVVDPHDIQMMSAAIHEQPAIVHTARAKLWPRSTKLDDWVWAHHNGLRGQDLAPLTAPLFWTFCFTYLPRALIEGAVKAGLRDWCYPHVDTKMACTARQMKIPCHLVNCEPKHLHY